MKNNMAENTNIIEFEKLTARGIKNYVKEIVLTLQENRFPQLRLSNNGDAQGLCEESLKKSFSTFIDD